MLRTRRIASLAGTVALATLSLTACGGSGDDSSATSATPADQPAATSVVESDEQTSSGEPLGTDAPGAAAPDTGTPDTRTPDTGSPDTTSGDANGAGEPAPTEPPVAVPEALQLVAPTIDGGELDLATLAGRPVLLWFWAPF